MTSQVPQHTVLTISRSDSYTEAVNQMEEAGSDTDSSSSSDSVESVEADNIEVGHRSPLRDDDEPVESAEPELASAGCITEDADRTLTGSINIIIGDDEVDHPVSPQRSPRKISRGRIVTGSKPSINVRGEHDLQHGKSGRNG